MLNRTTRVLKKALVREPRKNLRLRDLVEQLTDTVRELRQDLDLHSYRMAQMQEDIDLLKMKTAQGVKTKKGSQ